MAAENSQSVQETVARRSTLVTWSAADNWSLTMTPRTLRLLTRSMFIDGGGRSAELPRLPRAAKMISFDLKQFSFKLLVAAHRLNVSYFLQSRTRVDGRHYQLCVISEFEDAIAGGKLMEVCSCDDLCTRLKCFVVTE